MTTAASVVILEGPDGGGKTTLARWLRDQRGYQIVKTNAPSPKENVFKSYTDSLLAAVESGQPTVLDRHYLGEGIYGPLLRGEDRLGRQGRDLLERLIAACGVRLVICSPPWAELVKGWAGKDDLLKRQAQLRQVRQAYLSESRRLGLEVYDWTRAADGPAPYLKATSSLPDGVTGYHTADVLFIGERAGKKTVVWDLPFHNVTGSAKYLWDTLQSIDGWEERRGAWTNAFDAEGKPRALWMIVNALPRVRRVITLGEVADCECVRQGVNNVVVPHPQYWRRFHRNDMITYTKKLEDAINC
jgi:hypothetical protein